MPVTTGQDIRVTKTQIALSRTMMSLLEKKSFQKITVNDICQNAMVSRSTFYLHFEDKYQLLLFCLQQQRTRLVSSIGRKPPREFLRAALQNLQENQVVYRHLFLADINLELIGMFRQFFLDFFTDLLYRCQAMGVELPGPAPVVAVFYANGLAGMTMWWIEQNYPVSTDEMVECQYNLIKHLIPEEAK